MEIVFDLTFFAPKLSIMNYNQLPVYYINMLFTNQNIKALLAKYSEIHALRYLISLANWDTETYMPREGVASRGRIIGQTEAMAQKLFLNPEFAHDLSLAGEQLSELNDEELAVYRILTRYQKKYQKVPAKFIQNYAELTSHSSTVWAKARRENNFKLYQPYLEKIFAQSRELANYLGYEHHPYEALVDEYEPGMEMNDFENYFIALKKVLYKFDFTKKNEAIDLPQFSSKQAQKELVDTILNRLNFDKSRIRLDQTPHPFTTALAINDVRVTTNYDSDYSLFAIYSSIHEFGHGLFGMQTNPELEFTPQFIDISYGLHESQSRFWENRIARNRAFVDYILAETQKLQSSYKDITEQQFYDAVNEIHPTLIRVQADELTYHYHILIRYEIEKALLEKSITVAEAPEYWNSKYQEYLGIKPSNDAEGILQDIHWSLGYVGYFPTYSMGTIMSAAIGETIENDIGEIDDLSGSSAGIKKIQHWLKENIHQHGGTYTYKQVFQKIAGVDLSIEPWERYMRKKFSHLLRD
jgi:carboxypeptidase Taq